MATALVVGQASGVLAAPTAGPSVSAVVTETLRPVLSASVTVGGSGAQSLKFFARTPGSATWNLLNGTTVAGTTGTAQLPAGLSISSDFEYRAEHCDTTGCTTSVTKTGKVAADVGIGPRPGATTIPFTLGDSIQATVDAGSGNLMVSTPQLTVPRVAGGLSVGAVYNSNSRYDPLYFQTSLSSGWRLSTGSDVYLRRETVTGAVTYYGPNGLTGVFFPVAGTTGYTPPAGFTMDLSGSATAGWTLKDHQSNETQVFNTGGQLTALKDRNNNQTTFTYSGAALTQVVGDQGPTTARTLTVTTAGAGSKRVTGISQSPTAGSGQSARTAAYGYNAAGQLTTITDTLGHVTTFGYLSSGNLNSVTAPGGALTTMGYDALGRVQTITQPTATTGVSAVTRLAYTATTTVVADPNTDQTQSVNAVPRTTYTLTGDGMKLIASASDPTGAVRSSTYTPFMDVATATDPSGTTTFSHASTVNGGESLTGVLTASGASAAYGYGNTGAAKYSPTTSTDTQGNSGAYTYDGAGNQLTAADAAANTATVTYNGDGTVATSTSPSGAVTSYGYNTAKQVTAITPPAGTSLVARGYTYDGFGRLRSFTSGRGITQTYSYDAADRVTTVAYSDTTPTVTYSYDGTGRLGTRVDASGTTTYTYDPLGRLASRGNTAGGGTMTYTWDKAGNLATATDGGDTTTYTYDTREVLTSVTAPDGEVIRFATDPTGRRTDTWFNTNATNTTWAAHSHTDYDAAGQLTGVWTARNSSDTTRVTDLTYNYAYDTDGGICTSAMTAGKQTALRWVQHDKITDVYTNYCYDSSNRLVTADPGNVGPTTYTYDKNGNITQVAQGATVLGSATVNAADQITSSGYAYDASGNTTNRGGTELLTYNGAEQMTRLQSADGSYTENLTYAGTDQTELLTLTDNYTTQTNAYGRTDSNGLPLLESFTYNNTLYRYIYDPTGTPLAAYGGGYGYFLTLDGLGSTTALIDSTGNQIGGYSYDPYGATTHTGWEQELFQFTGGAHDLTGILTHFGTRWYDATIGRFTQQDSIEIFGDPSRANLYTYANDNPVNAVDPTGQGPAVGCLTPTAYCTSPTVRPAGPITRRIDNCIFRATVGGTTAYGTIATLNRFFAAKLNPFSAVVTAVGGCASAFFPK